MNPNTAEQEQIKAYLDAVSANLTGPDRSETLADLESHIYEAIAAKADSGEPAGVVDAVLLEMDPPEHYGSPPVSADQGRLCGFALAGALLLPWGLPLFYRMIHLTPVGDGSRLPSFYDSSLYHFLVLPVGVISIILSAVLGWYSVRRIRKSSGAISGFPLATIAAIFYPLVIVNMIAFIVVVNVLDAAENSVPFMLILPLILVLLLGNLSLFRRVYRSLKQGQSILRPIAPHIVVFVVTMMGMIAWGTALNRARGEEDRKEFQAYEEKIRHKHAMQVSLPEEISGDDLRRPWTGLIQFIMDPETPSKRIAERVDGLKAVVDPEVVNDLIEGADGTGPARTKANNGEYLEPSDLRAYLKSARIVGSNLGGYQGGSAGDPKALNIITVRNELYSFEVPVRYVPDVGWRLGKSDLIDAIVLDTID
ncbi:MAG: hypothetical protein ACJAR1_000353 [Rubritalea sp.]|jgi:hypothetical protein